MKRIVTPKIRLGLVSVLGVFVAATFEALAAEQPAAKSDEVVTASIAGAVNSPGRYQVVAGSLWQLFYRANGLKDLASDFVITRQHESGRKTTVLLRMPQYIGGRSYGVPWVMQNGDTVFVQTYSEKTRGQMRGRRTTTPPIPDPDPDFISHPLGLLNAEPNWGEYGHYLHVMIYAVEFHWERLPERPKTKALPGSSVTVKFVLNSEGKIVGNPNVVASDDQSFPERCVDALHAGVPYAKWPEGMERVLGKQQELTFKFWNQPSSVWVMAALGSSL